MTPSIEPSQKKQMEQSILRQGPGRIPMVKILDVKIHAVTMSQVLELIKNMAASGLHHQVATVNPEFIMVAQQHEEFRQVLNSTSLSFADGIGVVWASRILGHPLPERIPGVDVVDRLCALAAEDGLRVFLLGAAPGIAEEAARRLQRRNPRLIIAGTFAGSPKPEDDEEICEIVKKAQTDILFVAYGAPHQDLWIARNQPRLRVPVAMGVGGSFDFIVGKSVRAPKILRSLGLEWLHRLIREPRRWKRMLALPRFALAVFWEKVA
jgi:N-acetylglucosaminyldiphosphoundecaprenol N-acetyl-beta-D-mannosaminyltransferase